MRNTALTKTKLIWAGLAAIALVAITVSVFATQHLMNRLLKEDARNAGMSWAQHVATTTANLHDVVVGEASSSDIEAVFGQVAAVGDIYQFSFIDRNGDVVFKTGSYHPPMDGIAEHHAHSHEENETHNSAPQNTNIAGAHEHQSTDQHGAGEQHAAHDAPSADASAGHDSHSHDHAGHAHEAPTAHTDNHGDETLHATAEVDPALSQHSVKLHTGDGSSEPLHYAEVNHPVVENGVFDYAIRLRLDQSARFDLYQNTALILSFILTVIATLAVGIPATLFVRSRERAVKANEEIHYLAKHDQMTGLLNRASFMEKLEDAFQAPQDEVDGIALFIVDLDGFKGINDGFGHDVGDELLRQLGDSLRFHDEDFDAIARLGGDEFAAFLTCPVDRELDIDGLAERTLSTLTGIFEVNGHDVATTASIGVAIYPNDAQSPADLMQKADIALYNVKTNGRNGFKRFYAGMEKSMKERRNLEALLRQAKASNSFELHFQPLFDQESRQLIGFESLLRMRDEKNNFVPPDVFIPVAEEMGMMEELGAYVLRQATKAASQWPNNLGVAVNLSPKQFESGNLCQHIEDALAQSGLEPKRLELEITESLLMTNSQRNLEELLRIKNLGVSIAMDDFGTGYSSLSYLWKFPFDKIKIDKSFLGGMSESTDKATQIVSTIIALGHTLEMRVTAEGVETEEQAEFLNAHKCDQLQGFLLGRPMAQEKLEGYIRSTSPEAIRRLAVGGS